MLAIWSLIPFLFTLTLIRFILSGNDMSSEQLETVSNIVHTILGLLAGLLGGAIYAKNKDGSQGGNQQ